ncbi:hypothetical protein L5515_015294 [Caenorhabditis briggsae]|uniref:BTB domain-containing protein n=1 Tax=Caenorhabditis briggsae TaxID=6238 RepID=A0AAE9EBG9_CAEBR|nr:hypothetical protein L5515_015294 [Caenorhabditis briggsae]
MSCNDNDTGDNSKVDSVAKIPENLIEIDEIKQTLKRMFDEVSEMLQSIEASISMILKIENDEKPTESTDNKVNSSKNSSNFNESTIPEAEVLKSEKRFVLKHIFKNVKNFVEGKFNFSELENHFNVHSFIELKRLNGHLAYYLYICGPENGIKCLTVEAHVQIIESSGFSKEKIRKFDESNKDDSDVILVVNKKEFYVLRKFLAAQSSFFKALLLGNFAESKKLKVTLTGIDPDDFHYFLEVLYGELAIDENNVEGILLLANMYDAKTATRRCENFLLKESKKSLKKKLEMATRYHLENLKNNCMEKINTNEDVRSVLPENINDLDHNIFFYMSDNEFTGSETLPIDLLLEKDQILKQIELKIDAITEKLAEHGQKFNEISDKLQSIENLTAKISKIDEDVEAKDTVPKQAAEKSFILKHVFENVEHFVKGRSYEGGSENHFNVDSSIALQRLNDHLACFVSIRGPKEEIKWEVETKVDIKIDGPNQINVVLVVNKKEFYVLRKYLAAQSSFFKALLLGDSAESKKPKVTLAGIDPDDFHYFLEVLHGELAIDEYNIEGILLLANTYGAKTAIRRCENFLLNESKNPLKKKLQMAVRYNLKNLKNKCMEEIQTFHQLSSVIPSDINDLDHKLMGDLLKKAIHLHRFPHFSC